MTLRHYFAAFSLPLLVLALAACGESHFHQGENLYVTHCANCHMEDGTGLGDLIPPLAGADYLRDNPLKIACIIRHGMTGEVVVNGKTYNNPMAGIPGLTEFQIANIINYINQAWGNDYGYVKLADIRRALEECAP